VTLAAPDDVRHGTRPADTDPVGQMFASSSVMVHVVRGLVGLVLVVAALALAGTSALFLLLAVPGVVAWRGCPTCWTLGLLATLARRDSACASCSR
jgi:hypothetical protein